MGFSAFRGPDKGRRSVHEYKVKPENGNSQYAPRRIFK
jgi:hypothetical protein